MITCNDIYRMYQSLTPESEIHQAFREVAVDGRDGLYGNRTPLHLACLSADETAVRILIERGANINVKMMKGTPLYADSECAKIRTDGTIYGMPHRFCSKTVQTYPAPQRNDRFDRSRA